MKRCMGFLAIFGLFATSAFSQNISTPVMVLKDGDATATKFTGTDKTIYIDGGAQQSVGWIMFQTQGIDASKIASAKLVLYVNALTSPGTLQVRLLTADITTPENNVRISDIPAQTIASATQTLGTADVEKIVQIDLTAAVKAGTFKGVALTSDDGLVAAFDSKEGHLKPMILLTNNVNDIAAAWLSGTIAPAANLGKDGDYYLNTASGDVSVKATGAWTVKTNIVGATGSTGAQGVKGDQGVNGTNGADGAAGQKGDKGDKGDQGPTGEKGDVGATGPAGAAGATGAQGPIGLTGAVGAIGPQGSAGLTGATGPKGDPGSNTITDTCGNVYHTVRIGNQEWTVENLRTTKYNDGTPITLDTGTATWGAGTTGKYCWYGNDSASNKVVFGALYNWYAVNTGKLAPAGWHVPTDADWTTLENYLIAHGYNWDGTATGSKTAKSMAAVTDWSTSTTAGAIGNNLNRNNRCGFSALPGGWRYVSGTFYDQSYRGYWWSATEFLASYAWYRHLFFDYDYISRLYGNTNSCGFSVRLVRDLN